MKKLIQTTAAAALTVSGILSQMPLAALAEETVPEVAKQETDVTVTDPVLPEEAEAEETEQPVEEAEQPAPEAPAEEPEAEVMEEAGPEKEAAEPAVQSDYDGLSGLKGNFERVENGYRLANTGGNNHNLSDLSAKAFTFEADIEYVEGQNVSLMFGAGSADPGSFGTFFGLEVKNDNGNLFVKMFQDGPGGLGDGIIPYRAAGAAVDGNKAHLAVTVTEDAEMSITVNGNVVDTQFEKDFKNAYTGGYIGLLTWQTEAIVSNISFAGTDVPEAQFRTNLVNLHGLQGTWKETDEGLYSSGNGDNFAISDSVAKNVEFSANINNKQKKGAGSIAIRCLDNPRDGGYFINADYNAGIFKLFSFPSGGTVASAPMSSVPENEDGSYDIKIQMAENQIRVFVNGVGIINVEDTQHQEAGKLGLLTWDSTVVYQDVQYKEIEKLDPIEEAGLKDLQILTEGVHLNEAVDPAVRVYGLDVEPQVNEFSLKPEANGKISAIVYDEDWRLIRDLGEITDTIDLTNEDFKENFLNLSISVTNEEGFVKSYTFATNKWFSNEELAQEEYRPQFHVTPVSNFMNDPNGMVYDSTDGYWHMFYQYQPHNNGGDQSWGHVRSKDLVNWEQMPLGIQLDDDGLIFSGCALEDRNNVSGLFTDNKEGESYLIAYFTYHNTKNGKQSQAMAYSKDHGLTWIKEGIILDNDQWTLSGNDFRDPKVFQINGDKEHWYMVTAGGAAQLFVTSDLKTWDRVQNMTYLNGDQIHSECPMMFPAKDEDTGEELWVYGGSAGFYVVGQMEMNDKGIYEWHAISEKIDVESNANPWGGFGKYATMTFYNPDDERTIGVSWLMDFLTVDGKGFKGVQSLPQSYSVKKVNGEYVIVSYAVDEVNKLRDENNLIYEAENLTVTPEDGNILEGRSGITYDVEGVFDVNEASTFGFRLRQGSDGAIVFKYDTKTHQMILDLSSAGAHVNSGVFSQTVMPDKDGKVHLRLIVDQGAVEAFGNYGEANISTVLYTKQSNLGMEFFTEGTVGIDALNIYEMKSMYTGASKAETAETQLYLSAPNYVEPGQEFKVNATLYPDRTQSGVEWAAPGLELVSSTSTSATFKAEEAGEYEITAKAGGQEKTVTVRVSDPSFENNGDNWQATAGTWTIDGGGLHGKNAGAGDCFYLNDATIAAGEDFVLRSNVKIDNGQAAGIVFGVRDRNNPGSMWYCANIDTAVGIFKMFRNTGGQDWDVQKDIKDFEANEDGSYDLEVRYDADSNTLTYLVNGQEVGSHKAGFVQDLGIDGRGYTGYVTYHADATFNGFSLEAAADRDQTFDDLYVELEKDHTEEHFLASVPQSLKVKMTNGTLKDHDVIWDTSAVQFGTPGEYKAYGTLNAPAVLALAEDAEAPQADITATVRIRNSAQTADLEAAVETGNQLKEEDYTPETWTAFADALEAAKEVLAQEDPEQEAVDAALKALQEAKDALVLKDDVKDTVDKSDLESAVKDAGEVKADGYTEDSWTAFTKALEKAKAVLASENASQTEVDAALEALNAAREGLTKAGEENKGTDTGKDDNKGSGSTSGGSSNKGSSTGIKAPSSGTAALTGAALWSGIAAVAAAAGAFISRRRRKH